MHFIGLAILFAALVFGPSLWTRWTMARHADDRPDFPGTGGELARHLLDESGLREVRVEETDRGDHYDPQDKAIRLSRDNMNGRSLTAVTVATHEVGHALQDRDEYGPLRARADMVKWAGGMQRIGSAILFGSFFLGAVTQSPAVGLLVAGAGIATMASAVLVHLITLPVEFDASFNRAMPILDRGGYLPRGDIPAARSILRAAAMTYVAGSLASLFNLVRWIRYLR
ncbi:MAG: zinc metallopeptidase [Alphaproteobacteria bacterium]|nr:zinc metallopeptidase [Alphaproteobacteria bacterium]